MKGAATYLETDLDTKLLWLACRHHILELIVGAVWNSIFGPTKSADNLIFKTFQEKWKNIDTTAPITILPDYNNECLQKLKIETAEHLHQVLNGSGHKDIPRNDYREACELALIMLSEEPERWREKTRWQTPGAISNARWMAKIIYAPKMLAFSNQMKGWDEEFVSKLRDFVTFTSYVYVRYWMQASIGRDAPILDLTLYKELLQLQDLFPRMADAALQKLQKHTWYLTPEVVVFSLCSRLASESEKAAIAQKLLENKETVFLSGKPKLPVLHPTSTLVDFVTPTSWFILKKLNISGNFLELPVCEWKNSLEFQKFDRYVSTIKVVNDIAERGIKLCSEVIKKTKSEETRKNLLHVIENHRHTVNSISKQSMLEGLAKLGANNNN